MDLPLDLITTALDPNDPVRQALEAIIRQIREMDLNGGPGTRREMVKTEHAMLNEEEGELEEVAAGGSLLGQAKFSDDDPLIVQLIKSLAGQEGEYPDPTRTYAKNEDDEGLPPAERYSEIAFFFYNLQRVLARDLLLPDANAYVHFKLVPQSDFNERLAGYLTKNNF